MKKKVLALMKPKCAKLGFSSEELESAAERISGNLTEESSDDDINAQIDAVMPYLEISQKMATRVINAAKTPKEPAKEPAPQDPSKPGSDPKPEDLQAMITAAVTAATKPLSDEITALKSGEVNKSLFAVVKEKLKDVDEKFYALSLKGRSFGSQEEADEFVTDVQDSWKTFTEAHAKEGLSFSVPGKSNGGTGDDVDSLVSIIEQGTKDATQKS